MPINSNGYRLTIGTDKIDQYHGYLGGICFTRFSVSTVAALYLKPIELYGHSNLPTGAVFPDFTEELKPTIG
jgi:hypothetical protein